MITSIEFFVKIIIVFLTILLVINSLVRKINKTDIGWKALWIGHESKSSEDIPLVMIFSILFSLFITDALLPITSLTVLNQNIVILASLLCLTIIFLALLSWNWGSYLIVLYHLTIGTVLLLSVTSFEFIFEKIDVANNGRKILLESSILLVTMSFLFLSLKRINIIKLVAPKIIRQNFFSFHIPLLLLLSQSAFVTQRLVYEDKNIPVTLTKNSSELFSKINLSTEKENVYRILSELNLHDFYYQEYKKFRPKFIELALKDYPAGVMYVCSCEFGTRHVLLTNL